MSELLQTVSEIFSSYMEKNGITYYNIPVYQRGYKWDAENVTVLLDDIWTFHNKIARSEVSNQFYCLQNITLCKTGNVCNVVDGQQRLTTLLVLLSFLEKTDLVQKKIEYSIRKETHNFILEKIVSRSIWDDNAIKPTSKDIYYLCEVAKAIKDWFDEKKKKLEDSEKLEKEKYKLSEEKYILEKDCFAITILNHVKLIVNKLEGNEEKIFSSLNGGKVSLDGADLIRAILMTRAAKEKYKKIETKKKSQINELANEYRVRMGIEIDSANLWWGDKDVRTYFEQFIPKTIEQSKNKFDHTAFPINLLYMLYFESKKLESKKQEDISFAFSFFEYGQDSNEDKSDDHWEMYDEIMSLHYLLQEWYNNKTTYHYLGYLFFRFKKEINFSGIYQEWRKSESKSKFELLLKDKIITFILDPYKDDIQTDNNQNQTREELLSELKNDITNPDSNWYDNKDEKLFDILILQDILQCLSSESINRLKVEFFKNNSEDKEHILPQTPKLNEVTNEKKEWVELINKLEGLKEGEKEELEYLLPKEDVPLSDEQLKNIAHAMNKIGLNSIGNIVLLNASVNRGYGNADYLDKRATILSKYFSSDTYIRPHTIRIFMKGNSESKTEQNVWSLPDIKKNAEKIYTSIENWINKN